MKLPKALDVYIKKTRTYFFGLLAITPLLVLYESATEYLSRPVPGVVVAAAEKRNSAELLVKRALWYTKLRKNWMQWGAFGALVAGSFWLAKQQGNVDFKLVHFPYLIFESLIYALFFGFAISKVRGLMNLQADGATQNTMAKEMLLAAGAGIYEELLFRLLLLSVLAYVFRKVVSAKPMLHNTLAILLSAAIFSLYHYWTYADVPSVDSFLFRLYAGSILGILFVLRGVGVSVYTHAFYNLFLLFRG